MPISGWIMVGWFWLVILAGAGLLVWGWRVGHLDEGEEVQYAVLDEPEPERRPSRRKRAGKSRPRR